MRYSKRYLFMTIVLFVLTLAKFRLLASDNAQIESFRGASLREEDWNPLIAASVNEGVITLNIGSRTYTSEQIPMYMDNGLQLMIPVDLLRDALDCSDHIYDDRTLVIQKRDLEVCYELGNETCLLNGEPVGLWSPLTCDGETYYVSMEDVAYLLDYEFEWNMEENKGVGVDEKADTSFLPYRYDLREQQRISKVENQGNYGTCWAFATLTALESTMLPEEKYEFAEDHLSLCNSFGVKQNDGGDYTMSMAYLAAWQGPVPESDDPYGDGVSDESLKAVKHVQEMQVMEAGDQQKIKEAIFKYGGVQSSLYTTLAASRGSSQYYNSEKKAYCYQGSEKPNHDIVIIGWDDSYSKDNFSTPPEQDGAFICQNSWGEDFGDNGVFYVSYYDSNIGIHNLVITDAEDVDNYDTIYQSDLCGWVGKTGFSRPAIYAANVYHAARPQKIEAAGFYAVGKDTSVDVYVVKDFSDVSSLDNSNWIKVAEKTFGNAGYYTVKFDQPVEVETGHQFAIVMYINTPNEKYPMAIEYVADYLTQNVDITDGEGYISMNGTSWKSVEKQAEGNLCLKAYGTNQ